MKSPRRLHRVCGFALLVLFLATGVYMRVWLGGLKELEPGTRMLYRSRHIYLLAAGLIHLNLGAYLIPMKRRWRQVMQSIGSMLLIIASGLLIVAYFREPQLGLFKTPTSQFGIILLLAGTLFHVIATGFLEPLTEPFRT